MNKHTFIQGLLFIVLLVACFVFTAPAKCRTLKAATDYWPPFRIKNSNGTVSGIDIDLLRLIAEKMGDDIKIDRLPWARCLYYIKRGAEDLMTGVAKTDERSKFMVFSDIPYYSCAPAFYSRCDHRKVVRKYEDLRGQSIGYTRDSAYFFSFDHDRGLKKYAEDKEIQLLEMLDARRLDLIIGTDCQVDYDIVHKGFKGRIVKMPYKPEDKVNLYLGVSRKSDLADRMDKINKVLKELVNSGEIAHITHSYFAE